MDLLQQSGSGRRRDPWSKGRGFLLLVKIDTGDTFGYTSGVPHPSWRQGLAVLTPDGSLFSPLDASPPILLDFGRQARTHPEESRTHPGRTTAWQSGAPAGRSRPAPT